MEAPVRNAKDARDVIKSFILPASRIESPILQPSCAAKVSTFQRHFVTEPCADAQLEVRPATTENRWFELSTDRPSWHPQLFGGERSKKDGQLPDGT
jgi:hypothetical protein